MTTTVRQVSTGRDAVDLVYTGAEKAEVHRLLYRDLIEWHGAGFRSESIVWRQLFRWPWQPRRIEARVRYVRQ